MKLDLVAVDPEPVDTSKPPTVDPVTEGGGLRWRQFRALGMALYPTLSPYGKPTAFLCSSQFIAIGTYSAEVLLFDYHQRLVVHLETASLAQQRPTNANGESSGTALGPVTALNIDADESHLVAGFGLGWVVVWDLAAPPHNKPSVVAAVRPLASTPLQTKALKQETHMHGLPIVHCFFVTSPLKGSRVFASVDAGGLVVFHKHKRLMLERITRSRRVLGDYHAQVLVFAADSLVTGTRALLAVLTNDLLFVADLTDGNAHTLLSIPRVKDTNVDPMGVGTLKFVKTENGVRLVYSWGPQLKQLAVDSTISSVSAYTHPSPITQLDWIGPGLVVIASTGNSSVDVGSVTSANGSETTAVEECGPGVSLVDLGSALLLDGDYERVSPAAHAVQLSAVAQSVFVLGAHEFSVGQFTNWADRLLELLNAGRPAEAIRLAVHYYRDEGDLTLLGLPPLKCQREAAIAAALPDLIMTALQFGINYDKPSLTSLLPEAVRATVVADLNLLDGMLETIEGDETAMDTFYVAILTAVEHRKLRELPPEVFRALVAKHPEPYLFYNLSLRTLDLDLAFKLCRQYPKALGDVQIYLENEALNDYLTPLKTTEVDTRIFEYLTMVFTSRVFPTGVQLDDERASLAKRQIFLALFLGSTDLLASLLVRNESAMLEALNMGFADSWLNEDHSEVNRQIMVNVLLKIYKDKLSVPLSIFVARNYATYSQFIVLNGATLKKIVDKLTEGTLPAIEEQLALLSLLSMYKVTSSAEFIEKLVEARYSMVLEHVFRLRNKLLELARVQLQLNEDPFGTISETFIQDRPQTILFIKTHFNELLTNSPHGLGKLVAQFGIADMSDNDNLEFLNAMFDELHARGGKLPPKSVCTTYVKTLAEQRNDNNRLLWVLQSILTGEKDVDLPQVVDTLIQHDRIDALALLLRRRDRNGEAIIYIVNYLGKTKDSAELDRYVELACSICQQQTQSDRHEGLKIWQRVLEALVEFPQAAGELQKAIQIIADSDAIDLVEIARYLLDYSTPPGYGSSVLPANSNTKMNSKKGVRIVGDLHAQIVRKERALRCFLQLVQTDGYQDLLTMLGGRARGWIVPVDGECEVCGRKIVGLGIDAERLYASWERSHCSKPDIEDDVDDDTLVLFQCEHSYHYSCLRKMTGERECIICREQK